MKKADRKRLEDRLKDIENDARKADPETVRVFLRRKVGRWLIATLLGDEQGKNIAKADAYLYKKATLDNLDMMHVEECYLAALIVNESRFWAKKGQAIDRNIAKNWLMLGCSHLEDHAPICVIRDGRTYNHLSAIGAAKTFFFEVLE
ncbi:hypothetical protein KGO95_02165 [Patescibacteria group bacterium]|nr:hypothetical protein [Patescibacteria group bacterium]